VQQQFMVVGSRLNELQSIHAGSPQLAQSVVPTSASLIAAPGAAVMAPSTAPESALTVTASPALAALPGESDGLLANPLGLYLRVEGRHQKADATTFDPGFKSRVTGFTVGADRAFTPNSVLGLAVNTEHNRSGLDTGDASPSGNVSSRGVGVSLYGAYYPAPSAYLDATLVYSHSRYTSRRDIAALSDTALGETSSRQQGASFGGGYGFMASRWQAGPYARVSVSRTTVNAFTEQKNPTDSQLSVQAQRVNSLVSVLGAQASYAASQTWGVLMPSARLEWEHQYKDDRTHNILSTFAGDPSASLINLSTTPPDRNYFNLGAGLAAHMGLGRSAYVHYQTVLGRSGQTSHAITAELRVEL
jgi:outer membrane lipase/esterase